MIGATTHVIPYATVNPVYVRRLFKGTEYSIILRAPDNMPPDPKPVTPRPTINMMLEVAEPQMALPAVNTAKQLMKVHFREHMGYSASQSNCEMPSVSR
jgi:hypothetical protein